MQGEESGGFSIEQIAFAFRHPLLILCSFLIIANFVVSYVSYKPEKYQCSAVLAFESLGESFVGKKFTEKRNDLLGRVLVGSSIRYILEETWPDVTEESDPQRYYRLIERLRSPKNGIRMERDKRDDRLVRIHFSSTDPNLCYKVVKSSIDIILGENKKASEKKLKAGVSFLSGQVDFYRNKLKSIDLEMSQIKGKLTENISELSPEERFLISEAKSGLDVEEERESPALQQFVRYDEMLTELNLQLLEARNRKEVVQKRLEEDTFEPEAEKTQNFEQDSFIVKYSDAIAKKELQKSELMSKGFLPAHPDVKKVEREINDLNTLIKRRLDELKSQELVTPSSIVSQKQERLEAELDNIEFQIQSLNEKVALVDGYKKEAEIKLNPIKPGLGEISDEVARLVELKNEKEINMKYYTDLRKKLEEAQIASRLETEEAGFKINIIEEPRVPLVPMPFQSAPKIIVGLIFALGVGLGLAYLVDMMNDSIRSNKDLYELLGLPVLASINRFVLLSEIRIKRVQQNAVLIGIIVIMVATRVILKIILVVAKQG